MQNFLFEWYIDNKYHEPFIRHTKVQASNMKDAVYIFKKCHGSLRKNIIKFIQEIGANGIPTGDKVIPHKDEKTNDYTFTKVVA